MKKVFLLSISAFISCVSLRAQDIIINPIYAMEVLTNPIEGFLLPDSSVYYSDTTIFNAQMRISLYDTADVNTIIIKVGRSLHGSDVVETTFPFDAYRNGYQIALDLGNYSNLLHYYV